MPKAPVNTREFSSLVAVVEALRGPNGCPWDKEQTHATLTQYAIEEAHELAEAIDSAETHAIIEELGDLLLQVLLNAEIARQAGTFTLADVIQSICEKMIRRHPHVFSDVEVKDSREVLLNWAKIKEAEKAESQKKKSLSPFATIPSTLPALIRAQKMGAKTVRMNFDWAHVDQVLEKVDEEINELRTAIREGTTGQQQGELGDVLFSVVQVARHLNIDAEQSLRMTNKKFESRFVKMRQLVDLDGRDFAQLTVQELELYWQKAKLAEAPQ